MYANLKGELAKRGIRQNEIAHLLGVHENSINNKINGKSRFTIDEAFKIIPIRFIVADEIRV